MENHDSDSNIEGGRRDKFRVIAEVYRKRILAGAKGYEPNDELPPSRELAMRHGTTRQTISKVIDLLIGEGLLRANGQLPPVVTSRVATVPALGDRMAALHSTGKILGKGETCEVLEARMIECPADIAQLLRVETGDQVLMRKRVTRRNGKPIAYSQSYYPQFAVDAAPELAEVANVEGGARERAVYNLDRTQVRGREVYTARMANDEEKRLLELTAKLATVLQTLRMVTMDDNRVIEVAIKVNEGSQPVSVEQDLTKA